MKNYIQNPNQKVVITLDGNQTLARIYEDNKVVFKGIATCCEEDEFDVVVGSMTALTRAAASLERSRKKPKQEWVVVNRKPRAGDYVRLKETWFSFDRVGDILKVVEACGQAFRIRACEHPNYQHKNCNKNGANFDWCYPIWKVEVVEPAPKKPEYRKITRTPKKGDYMRVLKSCYSFDNPDTYLKIHEVMSGFDGKTLCVTIHSDDHVGALAEGSRCDHIHWNYSTALNKLEFYEKI